MAGRGLSVRLTRVRPLPRYPRRDRTRLWTLLEDATGNAMARATDWAEPRAFSASCTNISGAHLSGRRQSAKACSRPRDRCARVHACGDASLGRHTRRRRIADPPVEPISGGTTHRVWRATLHERYETAL